MGKNSLCYQIWNMVTVLPVLKMSRKVLPQNITMSRQSSPFLSLSPRGLKKSLCIYISLTMENWKKNMLSSFNQFPTFTLRLTNQMTVTARTCVRTHSDKPLQQLPAEVIKCHPHYRQVADQLQLIIIHYYQVVVKLSEKPSVDPKHCSKNPDRD